MGSDQFRGFGRERVGTTRDITWGNHHTGATARPISPAYSHQVMMGEDTTYHPQRKEREDEGGGGTWLEKRDHLSSETPPFLLFSGFLLFIDFRIFLRHSEIQIRLLTCRSKCF